MYKTQNTTSLENEQNCKTKRFKNLYFDDKDNFFTISVHSKSSVFTTEKNISFF